MQRFQSFKFEIMPTTDQQQRMRRILGCCRFVFNMALELQRRRLDRNENLLSSTELSRHLHLWRGRPDNHWLADAPVTFLYQALKNLERAFANWSAHRAQVPRFKKRGYSDGFRCSGRSDIKIDQQNSRIFLPPLGWLRYRNCRAILGEVRNIAVTVAGEKSFVSILTERTVDLPLARGPAVGIDMGVVRFATLSDGTFYAPLNSFRRHERALGVAQRSLARKDKYSNNWKKDRLRVQRIHTRISNCRRDYLHKISNTISKNHAIVCIEDLKVSAMARSYGSGKDRTDTPAAKRGLNKSILDQGWFEFRRQLEYKLRWNGARLIVVPSRNTSITCPRCAHGARANRKSQAQFECASCGFSENADLVGAVNVLRAGHARLACAESSPAYEASGQEPTDAYSQDF